MQRILIVTDDTKGSGGWQRELMQAGYPVVTCAAETGALEQAIMPRPPEILILDGGNSGMSPRKLREFIKDQFPSHEGRLIWLATEAQAGELDPTCGIDDLGILPASPVEVLARVRLLLWTTHRVDASDLMVVDDLVIDQANYSVSVAGQSLELTYKEYELLRFLVSHRGRVFTREALLNQVWGYDYFGGTRTVDVHIRRIRAKLGPEREDLVETIRNVGYKFNAP